MWKSFGTNALGLTISVEESFADLRSESLSQSPPPSALVCSEFAWPKINNLISGPKNLGWRCHVNSCKKRISILSILDGKDGARMGLRFASFSSDDAEICELMTFTLLVSVEP